MNGVAASTRREKLRKVRRVAERSTGAAGDEDGGSGDDSADDDGVLHRSKVAVPPSKREVSEALLYWCMMFCL